MPFGAPRGQDARDIRWFDGWVDHPGYAVTPSGILQAFRLAEQGYPQRQCDLFDDLKENDAHLRNLFEQRRQAVSGKPSTLQAGAAGEVNELAARVLGFALRRLPLLETFDHLLTYNEYGYGPVEIDWGVLEFEGRLWIVPVWFAPVQHRRFRISALNSIQQSPLDELRLFVGNDIPPGTEQSYDAATQTIALRPGKWWVLRRAGTLLARSGLGRTTAWPAMAKRFGFRDWLVYSQRFGLPLPVASYDDTRGPVDDGAIATAEQIVEQIGTDGGAVKPKSIELEMFGATKDGGDNSKSHGGLIAHCNREMSKAVNGSTLANDNADSGGASYALGEVHDSVRWDNVLYDAERLQESFRTQVAAAFLAFNAMALAGAEPPLLKIQIVRDLDPLKRVQIAEILLNDLGVKLSSGQLMQELGFREPNGTADTTPGPKMPAQVPTGGQP
jgi:phage gp29-like protein